MPINVPDRLPAIDILKEENIFIMEQQRAVSQDIRPLRIALCNLMPLKIVTETDFIRLLSNSPLQLELEFFYMDRHESKNTSKEHLNIFYKTFDQIREHRYDGLIITGAPVEHLAFEDVDYWADLQEVMDWSNTHVTNTLHICWGAQAGLYHHYGIQKFVLPEKCFGVFEHQIIPKKMPLFRGFDDVFLVPHSRYTETRRADIEACPELVLAALSDDAGVHIAVSTDSRKILVTGHFEYNQDTLMNEYLRDLDRGLNTALPRNYFLNDDPASNPVSRWRANAHVFFMNWLNYYVYQETPFEWV